MDEVRCTSKETCGLAKNVVCTLYSVAERKGIHGTSIIPEDNYVVSQSPTHILQLAEYIGRILKLLRVAAIKFASPETFSTANVFSGLSFKITTS